MRIQSLRGELSKVTQAELARRAGIDRSWLNRIERGRQLPTLTTTGAIVRALRELSRERGLDVSDRTSTTYVLYGEQNP